MTPPALIAALTAAVLLAGQVHAVAATAVPADPAVLTNLDHLDFLTDTVRPPAQAGHTTYRLDDEPSIGVLWAYADDLPGGGYRRVGGGAYDAGTGTYGQGAYDADDVSRAAVVYVRHWRQSGDRASRDQAYRLLRGLTYMQTATGPNAGNVVLWMQPDGRLNPSPIPVETPDPSDSGASYWLARTIWALGEGYAAFRAADPPFAAFLRDRLDLSLAALDRQVLSRFGEHRVVDGKRMPAWLVADGADASAEAVLGLNAYVRAGGPPTARAALARLAAGIAEMGGGTGVWPYGAVLPWARSRSSWHAWGAQMPSALAEASITLRDGRLLTPALSDAASFTPGLLTATGPINGLLPAPADDSQIAYGADARVQSLLSVSRATGSAGLRQLAGVAAGWFFGQNPANVPLYHPDTGATDDGVHGDGTVNLNSGAESTIHGLLTMLALDAAPDLAALARAAGPVVRRDGRRTVEAESGRLDGPVSVVTPASAWTGESQWSGGAHLRVRAGGRIRWTVTGATQPRLVAAVINRVPGPGGVTAFASLGSVGYGGGGAQGASPAPGALLPVEVTGQLPAGATELTATGVLGSGDLDALLLTPLVSALVTRRAVLLSSVARTSRRMTFDVPGTGPAVARSYDSHGRPAGTTGGRGPITLDVPSGGFVVAAEPGPGPVCASEDAGLAAQAQAEGRMFWLSRNRFAGS
ncbi:hypothetical protein Aca07nite_60190 [Actinoplanes capillaceus]|uniref:Uncharacterized protein n=1 Tax=Actinoplanes campanulatus TaxID=113559 RepID=A0ABQ3WR74_9ACTN|nr:hypothetical protein [Actinoplanes capillaceus]GID48744.1 hypothetical protein Aca07nite_60190 [Actinoplanes capillaceus]